jgi:hypothetical protein
LGEGKLISERLLKEEGREQEVLFGFLFSSRHMDGLLALVKKESPRRISLISWLVGSDASLLIRIAVAAEAWVEETAI